MNSHYTPTANPGSLTKARSDLIRDEFALIEDGFDSVETDHLMTVRSTEAITGTLPVAASRANKYLGFDGTGQPVTVNSIVGGSALGTSFVASVDTLAISGGIYTMTASLTLTLPATPVADNWVGFRNMSGTKTCVIARNGSKIMGLSENMTLDDEQAFGTLVYVDATRGWVLT